MSAEIELLNSIVAKMHIVVKKQCFSQMTRLDPMTIYLGREEMALSAKWTTVRADIKEIMGMRVVSVDLDTHIGFSCGRP